MSRLLNRLISQVMDSFVAHGVGLDDAGRLCLPDGLTPERVHRFIELCVDTSYPNPRAAIHDLFGKVGVHPAALTVLNEIIEDDGRIDLASIVPHWRALLQALPDLHRIPDRFRAFLSDDLALADAASPDLASAVRSTRKRVARRLRCEADWDEILSRPDELSSLAAAWRATL